MHYDEKLKARKARFEKLANKADATSQNSFEQSKAILDPIPAGQPILVGHHSEKRHRKTLERADNKMRQSVDEAKKADYYRQKAKAVGLGGINSDDEQALEKLYTKLEQAETNHETMKLVNKQFRSGGWEAVTALSKQQKANFTDKDIAIVDGAPFPGYVLSNSLATIKTIKSRISEIEDMQSIGVVCKTYDGFEYRVDDNRIQFVFDGKPEVEVRSILKKHAFKWSPSRGAWVRKLTKNALYSAKMVKQALLAQ